MRGLRWTLVVFAFTTAWSASRADDVDKVEEKLLKARDAYTATLSDIQYGVLKLIDDKDAAERKRATPDLTKLKTLKAEKDALEKDGELPKWLDVRTKDRINKARDSLIKALTEARTAYVRARDDDKAAAIDEEIEQVKNGVAFNTAGTLKDGMVFKGHRTISGRKTSFTVKVEEVKYGAFKGTATFGDKREYSLTGKYIGEKVTFVVAGDDDKFNQTYTGTIKDGNMTLSFSGTTVKGGPIRGNVTATLKGNK